MAAHATPLTGEIVPADPTTLALAGYLSRYRGATLRCYRADLETYWRWCAQHGLDLLAATRPHIELYVRSMEARGLAPATIHRRLSTVAGLYRYAVLDGILDRDPMLHVQRPKVPLDGQRRPVLHPLEFAALLKAAQRRPDDHALVALLGLCGLRVGEACAIDVTDLHYSQGYEILRVLGKGAKPAEIPLPVPAMRAVREAVAGRMDGPLLRSQTGARLSHTSARRILVRLGRQAGLTRRVSPHALRRTYATTGLATGIPLRDVQLAMRHADPRVTIRYDMRTASLDRHAGHAIAAYLAGMAG